MKEFEVNILAEDNVIYNGPCESLVVPSSRGQYGILAEHCNMIGAIVPGALTYRLPGQENQILAVSSGFVKIENNTVLVLVNTAERPEEIDANRAKHAAAVAKEEMLQKRSMREYRTAKAHLARALSRLKVKSYQGK